MPEKGEIKKYNLSGFEIVEYEELDSTNTVALQLAKEKANDKSVVLTYCQTRGRGQAGNTWESEPGRNLSMTLIFRPQQFAAGRQFAVSMMIALGCCDFIRKYVMDCQIKWPNDIYVGDRKIAGILIEHMISGPYVGFSVCGIGLNINQEEFHSDAPNPVSLFQLTGRQIELHTALEQLLDCMGKRYAQLFDDVRLEADYLKLMYRRKGWYQWEDQTGIFRATVKGVDEYGRLLLTDDSGRDRMYGFKEVKWC